MTKGEVHHMDITREKKNKFLGEFTGFGGKSPSSLRAMGDNSIERRGGRKGLHPEIR